MTPIIITGGAQRLGLAIAKDLKQQGYELVVTYRSHRAGVDELAQMGVDTQCVDFAQETQLTEFITYVKQTYPTLRGIIHNASDWGKETEDADNAALFEAMMAIHAKVPYLLNLALADQLLANPQLTDIIHMTDYVQDTGSSKHLAYAASKAALHNLTMSFAQKLAPQVKVNSIAPALVMFNQHDSDDYKTKALGKSLLQTCPGAIAATEAVNYLLTSTYVTGRCHYLDGGRHLKR